jgi:hypothetical protein
MSEPDRERGPLEAECHKLFGNVLTVELMEAQFRDDPDLDVKEAFRFALSFMQALTQCVYLLARRLDELNSG